MASRAPKARGMNGPVYLTIFRIFLSVPFLVLVLLPDIWAKIIALILFIVASLTDFIDGRWARKKKLVTDMGAFLDPLADKILVNLAFLALVYLNIVPLWVFAVILVRDFFVDGMRMMAAKKNKVIAASFYGKLKTLTQMVALGILLLNLIVGSNILTIIGNVVLYIALAFTVFSGADYVTKGWKQLIK